jgi:Holliday junction resolvase RusA-like endonuclease
MLPPSTNHYVLHPAAGVHLKSPIAKAWDADFLAMLPAEARGAFVIGSRFAVTLRFTPGPGDKGDVDNFNKMPLDCCAKAGMFRHPNGRELSDAWVKRLTVELFDSKEERRRGPKTEITIEAIGLSSGFNPFLTHFEKAILPGLANVHVTVLILTDNIDSKLCLELGASVLLDKPILVLTRHLSLVNSQLSKIATKVVEMPEGDWKGPEAIALIHAALNEMLP